MLIGGGGGHSNSNIVFNTFLPVRISVHRRTRLGVATLQGGCNLSNCFKIDFKQYFRKSA